MPIFWNMVCRVDGAMTSFDALTFVAEFVSTKTALHPKEEGVGERRQSVRPGYLIKNLSERE